VFFNETTKYVVSSTLTPTTWRNSELVGGYDPTLVRAMLADGLVDELHLFVYPLTRGSGPGSSRTVRRRARSRSPGRTRTTTASSTSGYRPEG
jgi:hypothetical protein